MGRINWVTVFISLSLSLAIYIGIRYVPVYRMASEVDTVLHKTQVRTNNFSKEQLWNGQDRILVDQTFQMIRQLGISASDLQVYFSPKYDSLHADYLVVVKHPVIGPTTHKMHRSIEIHADLRQQNSE